MSLSTSLYLQVVIYKSLSITLSIQVFIYKSLSTSFSVVTWLYQQVFIFQTCKTQLVYVEELMSRLMAADAPD